MKIAIGSALVVLATFLFTIFAIAAILSPLSSMDSRDVLIFAIGGAGLIFSALAFRQLRAVNAQLSN